MLAGRRVAVHVCRGGGFPQRARFEQASLGILSSILSSVIELEKGSAKALVIPTAAFLATAQGENLQRVSTGTKHALRQWLNMSSL
ncbi:hypothetical protein E2320_013659 [Naja naja]|nr:hypothetical protein E2320_013659 [Naja naja]